jgi:hypothetical protein
MVSARAGNAGPRNLNTLTSQGHFSKFQAANALTMNFSTANIKDREELPEGVVEGRSCNDLD